MTQKFEIQKETGHFTAITVDGKSIPQSKINMLNKALDTGYFRMYPDGEYNTANPFSGASIVLNGLALSVYTWCCAWYERYSRMGVVYAKAPIQLYDRMKYFLNDLVPGAYSVLID